jgi:hypothetical protein
LTISTTASSTTVVLIAAQTVVPFSFIADAASDITVQTTNTSTGASTTLAASQYTVTLNSATTGQLWGVGGYVTLNSAPGVGYTCTITRTLPLQQLISIQNQGDFAPQVTEQALDTLCMEIQQVSSRTGQFRGTWATGVVYNYGDIVIDGVNGANTTNWYLCAIANTSGTWATDLANGDWILILNLQAISNPGTVTAGGDLTGSYPNPTIAKIQGTTVTGVDGTGQVVMSSALAAYAPLASPTFTGVPLAPTASVGTNTTQIATMAALLAFLASSSQTQTGTSSTLAVTPSGLAATMIGGVGQVWSDQTANRAASTVYTNSTGRPIEVFITFNTSNGGSANLSIAGSAAFSVAGQSTGAGNVINAISFIVPPGITYEITISSASITKWLELR